MSTGWVSGSEPAIGTTYTVRWTYVKQMVKGTDYVDGGWFGRSRVSRRCRVFLRCDGALGVRRDRIHQQSSDLSPDRRRRGKPYHMEADKRRDRLSHIPGVSRTPARTSFKRLKEVGSGVTSYIDDGVDETTTNTPPASNSSGLSQPVPEMAAGEQRASSTSAEAESAVIR